MVRKEKLEKLTLFNKSNSNVHTRLTIVPSGANANMDENADGQGQLRIEDSESREITELELGPRCSKTFYLALNCPMDGNYSWEIYYEITKTKFSSKDLLCHVTAEVCYPILKMAHMSCSEIIPKELLYELTNAKKIDELLSSTPGEDPVSDLDQSELSTDEMIEVNFNCATYRSAPYVIRLEVFNPGNTDAKFKFKFPADFRMDLEGWAQHSTLSQDEYGILKIEENKLFQIIPKSGVLKSTQRQERIHSLTG